MIEKLTICINPEDSVGVGIVEFYDRVAAAMGLDVIPLFYDCTKINVSRLRRGRRPRPRPVPPPSMRARL